MEYIKDHIPVDGKKRVGTKTLMKYLTIHSTGNTATAEQERDWLENPSNDSAIAWHVVVDEHKAIEALPLNETTNHTKNSIGNSRSIGLEIAHREGAMDNAYKVAAKILEEENIPPENMRMHRHWTATQCPSLIKDEEWLDFQLRVIKEMVAMQKIDIVYNGTEVVVEGFSKNGKTYVGVREIGGILGVSVGWDAEKQQVLIDDELRKLVYRLCEAKEGK